MNIKSITVNASKYLWLSVAVILLQSLPAVSAAESPAVENSRVSRDLQALYKFDDGRGRVIKDESGVEPPLDLKIDKLSSVKWKAGAILVRKETGIKSKSPARKIIDAVKQSNTVTIEAWIKPADLKQKGPARIVSLSADANQRNITLGQDGNRYDVRLRTTKTSGNGVPSVSTPKNRVSRELTHVVYTRDVSGNVQIFLNGRQQTSDEVAGDFSGWDDEMGLTLANETSGGRPWLGELHLVAIYSCALTPREVEQNFQAGPGEAKIPEQLVQDEREQFFEHQIAPFLAKHCLECHDSASRKGGLNLSRMTEALAGSENGQVILPGKASESLLWDQIDSGEMPPAGEPLSVEEKALVKQWIDQGAVWSVPVIDPAVYVHSNRTHGNWLQRLTISEYIETVRSTFGVDIASEAHESLPPDLRADGFSNTAYNLNVDLKHVEIYGRLAEIIVSRMNLLEFADKFSKSRQLSTDATMRKLVAGMGKHILRGPLDEREINNYSGIATTVASAGGDYQEVVGYLVETMLQSPRFLYRMENQRGDGTAWPIGDYELASRLSYIIWGAPPDEELVRAADEGELSDRSLLEKQVQRMLQDPRTVDRSLQFVSQWLNLGRLDHMNPNREKFPHWDAALAADMREETLAFFRDVVWTQNRPLSDLFNAQVTYATPRLASHYGLTPSGEEFARYDLSTVPARGGLLTQGSVLTVGGDDASMVTRGLFVLQEILRGTVKEPPPGLDTTPVPSKPGLSQRGIAGQRIANESCTGCHSKIEPLAFGLEKYDGLGSYQEKDEYGNSLGEDGSILFPGAAEPVVYQTSGELMTLLAESERVKQSLSWKVAQFALGRPLNAADAKTMNSIHETSQTNGGTYTSLISAIVLSELVLQTQTEEIQPENAK